jgi:hypothetical protein
MTDRLNDTDWAKVAEAVAQQYQIERDSCGPKAPHGDITYKGVCLSSRYDVAHEFAHMRRVIDAMPELMARRIESIWCDSHACADYTVMIDSRLYLPELPEVIDEAFRACGGYNGLRMYADGYPTEDRDPYWPEYDCEP